MFVSLGVARCFDGMFAIVIRRRGCRNDRLGITGFRAAVGMMPTATQHGMHGEQCSRQIGEESLHISIIGNPRPLVNVVITMQSTLLQTVAQQIAFDGHRGRPQFADSIHIGQIDLEECPLCS